MSKELRKLLEKLNELATKMRALATTAEGEDRGFTPEENTKWDGMLADYDAAEQRATILRRAEGLNDYANVIINDPDGAAAAASAAAADPEAAAAAAAANVDLSDPFQLRGADEYRDAFRNYLRLGGRLDNESNQVLTRGFSGDWMEVLGVIQGETRAQGTAPDSAGGFLVPEDFAGFITETMEDFSGLLESASTPHGAMLLPTARGNNLPFPTNDDTANPGGIIGENTLVPDADTVFGERTLGSFMYTSNIVKISLQLMQDEAVNLAQYIGNILGKRIGRALSPHLAAGTGAGQPTGLVVAATNSALTLSLAASDPLVNGAAMADFLLQLEHTVDPAYRKRRAAFIFHDLTLALFKRTRNSNGLPLWMPGLTTGFAPSQAGATIDGFPYVIDQGMPTHTVATNRFIAFGDLKQYIIRQVLGTQLFRFNERYMDNLQVAFMGFGRWDGNLIDTEAVKYAASVI